MSVNLGEARGRITIDADPFNRGLLAAAGSLNAFYNRSQIVSFGLSQLGRTFVAAGGGIAAGLAGSVKLFADFDQVLRNVGAISDEVNANLQGTADAILEISSISAIGPVELAEALYNIVSAGVPAAQAMEILTVAAKAANAGLTDAATAARVITSVLNAGMKDAEGTLLNAASAADFLFKMVDRGVFTFEQLAQQIGDNTALAAQLGLSIEDLGAAYITLSQIGVPVAEVATQINAILSALLKPTDEVTANLAEMGLTTDDLIASLSEEGGLANVLAVVNELTKGEAANIDKLSSNIRAIKGVLGLTTQEGEKFTQAQKDMENASGSLDRVLERQRKSLSFSLRDLGNQIRIFATAVGGDLAPAIQFLARGMRQIVNIFNKIPDPIRQAGVAIVALTSAFLLLGGIGAFIAGRIISIGAALAVLRAEGALASQPFRLLLAPITSLIVLLRPLASGLASATSPIRLFGAAILLLLSPLRLIGVLLRLLISPLTIVAAAFSLLGTVVTGLVTALALGASAFFALAGGIAAVAIGKEVFDDLKGSLQGVIDKFNELQDMKDDILEFFGISAGTKRIKENNEEIRENRHELRDLIAEWLGFQRKRKDDEPVGPPRQGGFFQGAEPGDVEELKELDSLLEKTGFEIRAWRNKFAIGRRGLSDFFKVVGGAGGTNTLKTFRARLNDVFGREAGGAIYQNTKRLRDGVKDLNDELSKRTGIENFLSLEGITFGLIDTFNRLSEAIRTRVVPVFGEILGTVVELAAEFTELGAQILSGDFSGAFDTLVDMGETLLSGIVIPVGEVLLDIGAWALDQLPGIYAFLREKVDEAIDAIEAIPITEIAIEVKKWTVEQATTIWESVSEQVEKWWPTVKTAVGLTVSFLGALAIEIADWTITQANSIWTKVSDKVVEWWPTVQSTVRSTVSSLGNLVVDVAGWTVTQSVNLFDAIGDKVVGWALGGPGGGGGTAQGGAGGGGPATGTTGAVHRVGSVLVSIGGWVVTQTVSLFEEISSKITDWAFGTTGGGSGTAQGGAGGGGAGVSLSNAHRIESLLIAIGGWIITQVEPIWTAVSDQVAEWWGTVESTAAATVKAAGDLAVAIPGWTVTEAEEGNLAITVSTFITDNLDFLPVDFDNWSLNIKAPPDANISFDFLAIFDSVGSLFSTPIRVPEETSAKFEAIGKSLGATLGTGLANALIVGLVASIKFAFGGGGTPATGMGGPGGGAGGRPEGVDPVSRTIKTFIESFGRTFITTLGTEFINWLNTTDFGKELSAAGGDPKALARTLLGGLRDLIIAIAKFGTDTLVFKPVDLANDIVGIIAEAAGLQTVADLIGDGFKETIINLFNKAFTFDEAGGGVIFGPEVPEDIRRQVIGGLDTAESFQFIDAVEIAKKIVGALHLEDLPGELKSQFDIVVAALELPELDFQSIFDRLVESADIPELDFGKLFDKLFGSTTTTEGSPFKRLREGFSAKGGSSQIGGIISEFVKSITDEIPKVDWSSIGTSISDAIQGIGNIDLGAFGSRVANALKDGIRAAITPQWAEDLIGWIKKQIGGEEGTDIDQGGADVHPPRIAVEKDIEGVPIVSARVRFIGEDGRELGTSLQAALNNALSELNFKETGDGTEQASESGGVFDFSGVGAQISESLSTGITSSAPLVSASISSVTTEAFTVLQGFLPTATDMGIETGDNYGNGILDQLGTVTSSATSLTTSVFTAFQTFLGTATAMGVETGENYASGVASQRGRASGAGSSVASAAVAAMGGYSGLAYAYGSNIGHSFANGIASAIGAANAAANALASAAARAVAARAEIASPSRLFMRYGRMVGVGFAMGIAETNDIVRSASRSMVQSTFPDTRTALPGIESSTAGGKGRPSSVTHLHGVTFVMPELQTADAVAQYLTTLG